MKKILNTVVCILFFVIIFQMATTKHAQSSKKVNLESQGISYKVAPGNMQNFYRIYAQALHKIKDDHDNDSAIILLETALKYAEVQPEAAMIHYELAAIYREKKDYKKELISQQAVAKYTMNEDEKKISNARADELLIIISLQTVQTGHSPEGKH